MRNSEALRRAHTLGHKPLIVGVGGTLRPGSTTEHALRVSLRAAEEAGARTALLVGADIVFPMYDPNVVERTSSAARFVNLLRECDGLIIGSPGYHGSMSGLIKNALDYDLRECHKPYLDRRAVGCIACGAGWQAVGSTLATLRAVIHALRGWPTPMGGGINTSAKVFDNAGYCVDGTARMQLELIGRQVFDFAQAFSMADTSASVHGSLAS